MICFVVLLFSNPRFEFDVPFGPASAGFDATCLLDSAKQSTWNRAATNGDVSNRRSIEPVGCGRSLTCDEIEAEKT